MDQTLPTLAQIGPKFFASMPWWSGWLAVNLFFVLSGFVLYLPYAEGKRTMNNRDDLHDCYKRRALRLLPLFWFCLIVCLSLVHPFKNGWATLKELTLTSTGLFHFVPLYFWPGSNPVLWSLGTEIWFAVLFPLVAAMFLRLGAMRSLIACLVFSLAVRFIAVLCFHGPIAEMHINPFKDNIFGRLDDFALGMFVAHLYAHVRISGKYLGLACLVIGGGLVWIGMGCWGLERCALLPSWTRALFNIPIGIGFAAILYGAIHESLPKLAGVIFRNPLLQLTGMMCFSMYVWHFEMLKVLVGNDRHDFGRLAVFIGLLYVISFLSYRYIEFGREKDVKRLLPDFSGAWTLPFQWLGKAGNGVLALFAKPADRPQISKPQ